MQHLKFSGHESFICKQLWPKKGFDFLIEGNKFTEPDAVVKLGVGKNMVLSIKFWLKALGLIDETETLTLNANKVLSNHGYDPYLEDIGTIWLLHYFLVKTEFASIYSIVFNDFSKINYEFTKLGLHHHIKRISTDNTGNSYNEHTVNNDISVFLRNYLQPGRVSKVVSFEDEHAALFLDLDFIRHYHKHDNQGKLDDYYVIERKDRQSLPKEIFLFAILHNLRQGNSISFNELVSGHNSVGNIFQMNREGVYQKIEEMLAEFHFVKFTQTAGLPLLTFTEKPDPSDVLTIYYENKHVHSIN